MVAVVADQLVVYLLGVEVQEEVGEVVEATVDQPQVLGLPCLEPQIPVVVVVVAVDLAVLV
jgi:hypothetical protein